MRLSTRDAGHERAPPPRAQNNTLWRRAQPVCAGKGGAARERVGPLKTLEGAPAQAPGALDQLERGDAPEQAAGEVPGAGGRVLVIVDDPASLAESRRPAGARSG